MNYRQWIKLLLVLACVGLCSACTTQEDTEQKQQENTTSTHITYDEDDAYQAYDQSDVEVISLSQQSGDVAITKAGTYLLQGSLQGSISIAVSKEDTVRLILDNVEIQASNEPAIACTQAKKLIISLPEGTNNVIEDAGTYEDQSTDAIDATIFSQDDLTINGTGTLQVNATYLDAIKTKDTLKLMEGTYEITSADDAFTGKDFIYIHAGTYQIQAEGDGFKTTYDTDDAKGDLIVEDGSFQITAGSDGFQSVHQMYIYDGTFVIESGGGSINGATSSNAFQPGGFGMWNQTTTTDTDTTSAKGIKAGGDFVIYGGTYHLDTSDDALHSNANLTIMSGNYTISSGDDGMHADETLTIEDGTIDITKSYEGLEGNSVIIQNGYIQVTSSDDGINSAGGSDDESSQPSPDRFGASGNHNIEIYGGSIQVDANGDGLDANGSILMESGTVVIFGPEDNANAALDYDGTFDISGGTLVAVGPSGMAMGTSQSSTQNAVMVNLSTQSANTIFYLTDAQNQIILGVSPTKSYSNVLISTADLTNGETYSIYTGGSGGSINDEGLITNALSGGTLLDNVTISGYLTTYGSMGMGQGGPQGMGGGQLPEGSLPEGGRGGMRQ